MQMTVVETDITALDVDAVVNAANSAMRGGGGVDGAIHRAAGPSLLEECVRRFPDGLATGRAGWTPAGELPASWVIHVVGPNRNAGQTDPELLASCYREALRVADEVGAESLAFPLVSAGVYGWNPQEAARIAVQTLQSTSTRVQRAQLVAFNEQARAAWEAALAES
ncbi:MAG TPA: O-acetyl-ADP-ribose deacetylase [Nocardioidaceae bacterium]|nr:O-acetyl-ADP-ribose deacetylase [Nocardioidaceae bacterium]